MRDFNSFLEEGKDKYSPESFAKVEFWKQFSDVFKKFGLDAPSDGRCIMYVNIDKPIPFFDCDFEKWKNDTEKWLNNSTYVDSLLANLPKGTKVQNGFNKRGYFVEISNSAKELKKLKV
jgi:hypothetical protein